jgi:hypothetical protein
MLGAFVKLRKATISSAMSVRVEQLYSDWTGFHEILYLRIFKNLPRKFKFG